MMGRILLGVVALLFLGGGMWPLWSITYSIYEWRSMQSWTVVQAHVLKGGFQRNSGRSATTYSAYVEYIYRVDGRQYTGTRAAINSGADNIGSFQENLGRHLANAKGRTIDVFVDPDHPGESIVNRDLRWILVLFKSVFVILFGGIGVLFLLATFRAPKSKRDVTQRQYKDSPWLANDAWRMPEIRSNSKSAMQGAWVFAIIWNIVSAWLPWRIYEEVTERQNYLALIGFLFPLVGIGLLVWAVRRTLEWKRFGNSPVVLDPFPGSIGGNVGGTIELGYPHESSAQFNVTLASIYSYVSGRGKNRKTHEDFLWQHSAIAHTEPGQKGTRLIFRFDVPEGLHPSDAVRTGNEFHLWRLSLKASLPGIDIDRDYEIPVYPTRQESARIAGRAVEPSQHATLKMQI